MLDLRSEDLLRKSLSTVRIVGLATCVGAPLVYAFVLYAAAFQSDGAAFINALKGGAGPLPLKDPVVLVLLSLSPLMLLQAFVLRFFFFRQAENSKNIESALGRLRLGTIASCALLESVAIFGLVLGFVAGQAVLPLSLALIAVPILAYVPLVPGATDWRRILESASLR